jgi:CheY-like chemotaxis protein
VGVQSSLDCSSRGPLKNGPNYGCFSELVKNCRRKRFKCASHRVLGKFFTNQGDPRGGPKLNQQLSAARAAAAASYLESRGISSERVVPRGFGAGNFVASNTVQCVANGNEAFLFVDSAHTRPALIFLDLVMPVLDGWGFLAERVNYPLLADVPVVILSGCPDVAQKAKEAGAVAFMRKPAEPLTLVPLIEYFDERI